MMSGPDSELLVSVIRPKLDPGDTVEEEWGEDHSPFLVMGHTGQGQNPAVREAYINNNNILNSCNINAFLI